MLADACIHADHHTAPFARGKLNHLRAHPVAFFHPVRNVDFGLRAQRLERCHQNHGRHGTVNIIITVDQDLFLSRDSPLQAIHCYGHILHEEGIMKMIQLRRQKTACLLGVLKPAQSKQASYERWEIEILRKLADSSGVRFTHQPAHGRKRPDKIARLTVSALLLEDKGCRPGKSPPLAPLNSMRFGVKSFKVPEESECLAREQDASLRRHAHCSRATPCYPSPVQIPPSRPLAVRRN